MKDTWIFLPSLRDKGLQLYEELSSQDIASVAMDRKPGGFWKALNRLLYHHRPERFIWLADDCELREGWLERMMSCWEANFPDDLGIVVCNDLVVMQGGAAFAMTSPKWLSVLFGSPWFPKEFGHKYLDTIIADRSKDLGRYFFCREAVVEHKHPLFGKGEYDAVYENNLKRGRGDKKIKDRMDAEWRNGGFEKAVKRAEKAGIDFSQPPVVEKEIVEPPLPPKPRRKQSEGQSNQSRRKHENTN